MFMLLAKNFYYRVDLKRRFVCGVFGQLISVMFYAHILELSFATLYKLYQ